MKKIYLRCDANDKIGFGHLSRCSALFFNLKDHFHCQFIFLDTEKSIIESFCGDQVDYICVKSESEILGFVERGSVIVFDGYSFTSSTFLQFKQHGVLVSYIDDLGSHLPNVDLIINHAPGSEAYYHEDCLEIGAFGLDYAMIRPVFLDRAPSIKSVDKINSIFLSFGGSPKTELVSKALNELVKNQNLKRIYVVLNDAMHFNSMSEIASLDSRIDLRASLTANEMSDLMIKSDLAILPASTLAIEALFAKCIIILGTTDKNQQIIYKGLKSFENIYPIGIYENFEWATLKSRIDALNLPMNISYYYPVKNNFIRLFETLFLRHSES